MVILHVLFPEQKDFVDAARHIFDAIGISRWEEHESENYPGGQYFKGSGMNLNATIALEDDFGYDDYQYWAILNKETDSRIDLESEVENVAVKLLRTGLGVARGIENDPAADADHIVRVIYELDSDGRVRTRKEKMPITRS